MSKLYLFIMFFSFLGLNLSAQIQEPVRFTVEQKKTGEGELEVRFKADIDEGWHVYGPENAEGGPTVATLTLENSKGVELKGGLKVDGKVHRAMDEMFEMEVTYVEGEASFVQTFTITEAAYEVSGYLTYGACSDQNCMPPTDVEFSFKGNSDAVADPAAKTTENEMRPEENKIPSGGKISEGHENWWKPVVEELQSFGQDEQAADNTLWGIFLLGFLGGFVALFTPCVWPIIPMTVSFFLKRSQDKRKGVRDAVLYGVSIVVIYVLLGLLVTMIFGASALNALSTNAVFNIFFFLMLLFFAASFLGGFEITLPSKWTNAVDKKSESTTGLLSIFLMAFTLSLVSFSCTGPIIGFLLVEVSTTGSVVAPTIGMLGFAVALALPFTLFALFPAWLKSAPKSGNWMNCIKVCLGFLELAFALKFLSVADLAYGWRILDREVFLSIWIVLFALLGAYLIGWIRFPHDEDEYDDMGEVVVNHRTSVPRFFMGLVSFAFALYMVPGLWGAPCKAVSAFAPPMSTQDFNLYQSEVKARFHDYEEGMAYAQANGLPVMLDFTGYGCVNCRKMEAAVWTDIKVADLLNEKYVLITLFVDDKTPLAEPIVVTENGAERKLRTIGDKWSYLQRSKFGANAQPFYVLLDNEGMPLNKSYSFNENVADYVTFLQQGLKAYHK
ncbi:MAG: thioredoxin family protein [Bacteroidaceae bacterium]|nr:thioredoxin family protein [Bacteroidaceae bacterium]